jgi:membrane-associated phospholipid phosphatase
MNQFTIDSINWLQRTFGSESRVFFDFFSSWGGPTGWLLVGALVFWLSGSKAGLRVGFSTSIAGITNTLLKWTFALPRPYYLTDEVYALKASDGLGMPSGHAQGAAALWGAIAYFIRRWWCIALAILFILCTGAARIYYAVHSPLQVLVGWGLGLLTVVFVVLLEDPLVRWCRSKTPGVQFAGALAVGIMILVLGLAISSGWRGNFHTPQTWQSNWQATAERISLEEGDEEIEDFLLIEPGSSVNLACYFLGYAFCGLLLLRIGNIRPCSVAHRCANVVLGVPILVALVLVTSYLEELIGGTAAEALLSLTVPTVVGIALPNLTGRVFRAKL